MYRELVRSYGNSNDNYAIYLCGNRWCSDRRSTVEDATMITHYTILLNAEANRLSYEVNQFIGDGWQPHGSLVVEEYATTCYYIQAMVKSEPDNIFADAGIV